MVYVQDSIFNVTDETVCQDMCNNTTDCTFWSISLMPDHDDRDHEDSNHQTRVKRNHQGVSECGIR